MLPVLMSYLAMAIVYFIPESSDGKQNNTNDSSISNKSRHKNLKKLIKMKHKSKNNEKLNINTKTHSFFQRVK